MASFGEIRAQPFALSLVEHLIEAAASAGSAFFAQGSMIMMTIKGWLADPGGGTTRLAVLICGRDEVAATRTREEHPDVTQALGSAFGVPKDGERNLVFAINFDHRTARGRLSCALACLGPDMRHFLLASALCS